MKAILIIDMPKKCSECPCFYDYLWCQVKGDLYVLGDERPKECPLKPLPQKIEGYIDYEYGDGWNDCIDEILGGVKDE